MSVSSHKTQEGEELHVMLNDIRRTKAVWTMIWAMKKAEQSWYAVSFPIHSLPCCSVPPVVSVCVGSSCCAGLFRNLVAVFINTPVQPGYKDLQRSLPYTQLLSIKFYLCHFVLSDCCFILLNLNLEPASCWGHVVHGFLVSQLGIM